MTAGVGLMHRPRLARILRQEARTLAASDSVSLWRALWRARHPLAPHLRPRLVVSLVLILADPTRNQGLRRLQLRGLLGAGDELVLAAAAPDLRMLAWTPATAPPAGILAPT